MTSYSMQTDPGLQYDDNEDCVGFDAATNLWLVADGMGGHAAGEVASQIAKDTFIERISAGVSHTEAVLSAHTAIAQSAEAQQAQQGMGSTLVAMQIDARHAGLVWVGDSRGYLWRDGRLSVITHDHSYVQMLIDQGHLTDETARDHPKRNMVTQVLGLGEPEPETRHLPLKTGDWLVLCSDGLNDELTDTEIAEVLVQVDGDVQQVAPRLIEQALANGGRDNVSVVAVEYDGPNAEVAEPSAQAKAQGAPATANTWGELLRSPLTWGIVAAVLVFIIFVMVTKGG